VTPFFFQCIVDINDPFVIHNRREVGQALDATGLASYGTVEGDEGMQDSATSKPTYWFFLKIFFMFRFCRL
jgi:hypothetical protein